MSRLPKLVDINGGKVTAVQVQTAYSTEHGITLWVNVDGICRLRVVGIPPEKYEQDLVGLKARGA